MKEKDTPLFFSAEAVLGEVGLGTSIPVRWVSLKIGMTDRKLEQKGRKAEALEKLLAHWVNYFCRGVNLGDCYK